MELRPGYKRTLLGVLPEEWEVARLGDIGHWRGGATPSMNNPSFWANGQIPWVSSGDVKTQVLTGTSNTITEAAVKESSAKVLPRNAVVVVTRSGILRKYLPVARLETAAAVNQDIKAVVPKNGIESEFLLQMLLAHGPSILTTCLKAGTTVESVDFRWLKEYRIPIPPTNEQRAIAAALRDADALISSMTKQIAKKRDLKLAVMHQLLTGMTRLPSFSEEWDWKRLGDLGTTYGGLTGKTKADFGDGSAQYIPFLNVIGNVVIDPKYLVAVRVGASESQNQARKGDLFFNGSSETPDEVGLCAVLLDDLGKVYLNSFCFGFRLREGANADGLFVAYLFRSGVGRKLLRSLAQGATRYNLSKRNLLQLEIPFPTLSEQSAIASVLSDMDSEIAALEHRKSKTRVLKQGMMQELLSGRTRLV